MRLLDRLLSGDRPGHPVVAVLAVLALVGLALAPFLVPGATALAVAARICIFILLAASYDILLGYTGIVSFAHTMFFGFGAYGAAIALSHQAGWGALLAGATCGVGLAVVVAGLVALLSLRVQAIFFSMVTLAIASFAQLLATQLRGLTGGEDGLTFAAPPGLAPSFRLLARPLLGLRIDGRVMTYYLIFAITLLLFLAMLRVVNSPFGRVLQAMRENALRAEALGYRTLAYRCIAIMLSAAVAAVAGVLMAVLLRYVGPPTTLSFDVMTDILLMVVIGGMGTLYGAVFGAVLVVVAQYELQPGMQALSDALAGLPLLAALVQPDRWLLWLGLLFIAMVYFFPAGLVGSLRQRIR